MTNNKKQFDNTDFKGLYEDFGTNFFSSLVHPLVNRQLKVINKIIKHHFRIKLEKQKGAWVDKLLFVLWTYKTTQTSAIRETSYSLASTSRTGAVTPVNLCMPFYRV